LAEFLQKLNAGKAVSAAGMTLSEIVETIYIPYTQEKRASTRIRIAQIRSLRASGASWRTRSRMSLVLVPATLYKAVQQRSENLNKHLIAER